MLTKETIMTTGLLTLPALALPRFSDVSARISTWRETQRQRRALLDLDARGRADIGITEGDALREAGRLFWSVRLGH
jgi:uncharacterized protein YjiS (DUF1127 family)